MISDRLYSVDIDTLTLLFTNRKTVMNDVFGGLGSIYVVFTLLVSVRVSCMTYMICLAKLAIMKNTSASRSFCHLKN